MGHQVNFFATPADIAQLEERIGTIEPMLILHSRSPNAEPRVVTSLRFTEGAQPWLFYHLVREADLSRVVTEHVPAQRYWSTDVLGSPVVQFNCCYFDGTILRRGRVYYVDGSYGPDKTWVEKPQEFRAWAQTILKMVRKHLKKRDSNYVGVDALKWLDSSGGTLVE